MRFSVFTHVEHVKKGKPYYGYAPYIREMNLWLRYVEEVEVVAPFSEPFSQTAQLPYEHSNIYFTAIPSINFIGISNAFYSFLRLPLISFRIMKAMMKADHLHLRCPGNIGLIACFLQIFFPKKPKTTKYAGNWDPEAVQPWSYNFQKWILSNTFLTRNMKVLVYGKWSGQTKNIQPFFTASFSEKEIDTVKEKTFTSPFNFVFVGNLVPGKHPLLAVKMVEELKNSGYDVSLDIYGDGPEMQLLQEYSKKNFLEGIVCLKGSRPLQELQEAYQKAHFLILPSQSEGWPKAIAEAMFFGCIPIATAVSCVPWMLGSPLPIAIGTKGGVSRGILIPLASDLHGGSKEKLLGTIPTVSGSLEVTDGISELEELMKYPEKMKEMSEAAKEWSQQYTLERFEEGIRKVLGKTKGNL